MKKVAYIALAALCVLAAGALVGLAILQMVHPLTMLGAAGALFLAKKIFDYALTITKFDHPLELQDLQRKAAGMDFLSLYREHGVEMKRLLSESVIAEKFGAFIKKHSLETICSSNIDLYALHRAQLISRNTLLVLESFRTEWQTVENLYQDEIEDLLHGSGIRSMENRAYFDEISQGCRVLETACRERYTRSIKKLRSEFNDFKSHFQPGFDPWDRFGLSPKRMFEDQQTLDKLLIRQKSKRIS